ncbi:MAG: phosphodiester glycosidase family protein [Candidatus Rokuibacteriota bacterium]
MTTLMPGVKYERETHLIGGSPVVVHVVRTPSHGGLYRLRPAISNNTVVGRQTVPAMQRSRAATATSVGVNGDRFQESSGRPSGVFLRNGVLYTRAFEARSSLAIAFDGRLLVDRFGFRGWWRAGENDRHLLEQVNDVAVPPGVALFTPARGGRTPRISGVFEVVFARFPRAMLNGWLTGTVTNVRWNGGTAIPPRGAVLQARGTARPLLRREARAGTQVTVRLRMPLLPDDAADAIGGGPLLVRNGNPVRNAGEYFSLSQLAPRHPRTAVGQRANGSLLFVVADGRLPWSRGVTNWQLARLMARLGAVTAMGLDAGGSSTLAFEGRALNTPPGGTLRPVSNALFLEYYGIHAPAVTGPPLSPNGDGVVDSKTLVAKVVRRSRIELRLVRPNGTVAWRREEVVGPRSVTRRVGVPRMQQGRWRWVTEATEISSGRTSRAVRRFMVNRTLGHLTVSKDRVRVRPRRGGRLALAVSLTREAQLDVSVRRGGRVVRALFTGRAAPGAKKWVWNGRTASGRVAGNGRYVVRVRARNGLGAVSLQDALRVVRVRR